MLAMLVGLLPGLGMTALAKTYGESDVNSDPKVEDIIEQGAVVKNVESYHWIIRKDSGDVVKALSENGTWTSDGKYVVTKVETVTAPEVGTVKNIYLEVASSESGSGGDSGTTTTVTFGKVTDASQITADNIGACTFAEAKAWVLANWDDVNAGVAEGNYVDFVFADGGDLNKIDICVGKSKSDWDASWTADYYEADKANNIVYTENLNKIFGQGPIIYFCGFEGDSGESKTGTDYILTIPAQLTVKNAGWNATEGIKAKVSQTGDGEYAFDASKKLSVTASSVNSWALKCSETGDTVGYNLAGTGSGNPVYAETAEAASWVFTADELNAKNGTTKAMGIIVEDYSGKSAGTYKDTVTFTAQVVTNDSE